MTRWAFDTTGVIREYADSVPRVSLLNGGTVLLDEPTRRNEMFPSTPDVPIFVDEDVLWELNGTTAFGGRAIAPDGTTTGVYLEARAGFNKIERTIVATSTTMTHSYFVKENSNSSFAFGIKNITQDIIYSDTESEDAVVTSGERSEYNWYRHTFTSTGIDIGDEIRIIVRPGITGDAGGSIYVWGFQFEDGAYATSFIPTTDFPVTRKEDEITLQGNTWGVYNSTITYQDDSTDTFSSQVIEDDYWFPKAHDEIRDRISTVVCDPLVQYENPQVLFGGVQKGMIYDPADTSTMYKDGIGNPLTEPGDTVAVILDKSEYLVRDVELVTDPTFLNGVADWDEGPNMTANETAGIDVTSAPTSEDLDQLGVQTTGDLVEISVTITNYVEGGFKIRYPFNNATMYSGNGTFTFVGIAEGSLVRLMTQGGSSTFTYSEVSVKKILGNHALQTVTSKRPIYGVEPVTSRRNILLETETVGAPWSGYWVKPAFTFGLLAPDGTNTAFGWNVSTTTGGGGANYGGIFFSGKVAIDTTLTASCWFRASAPILIAFGLGDGNSASVNLTTTWTKYTYTGVVDGDNRIFQMNNAVNDDIDIEIWHPQTEFGPVATDYQRVGETAYDITEEGVQTRHYLHFDGIDDALKTDFIDFSGTDNMSVFLGLRRLSDSALGVVCEFSGDVNTNIGTFNITADEPAGITFNNKGTLIAAASSTNVVSGDLIPEGNFDTDLGSFVDSSTGSASVIKWAGGEEMELVGAAASVAQTSREITTVIGQSYNLVVDKSSGVTIVKVGSVVGNDSIYSGTNDGTDITISFVAETTTTFITVINNQATNARVNEVSLRVPADVDVITGLGDISGDTAVLRLNGVVEDTITTDQGTGDYHSSKQFFLGSRADGLSAPFHGNLYSMIIRGASMDDLNLVSTEAYIAAKTGITL